MRQAPTAALIRALAITAICASAGACVDGHSGNVAKVAVQDVDVPKPDVAKVVIYRPSSWSGRWASPAVQIDNGVTCDIANDSAFVREMPPGPVTVAVDVPMAFGVSKLAFTAEAGKTYYVRIFNNDEKTWAGMFGLIGEGIAEAASDEKGPYRIHLIAKADAQTELAGKAIKLCDVVAKPATPDAKSAAAGSSPTLSAAPSP